MAGQWTRDLSTIATAVFLLGAVALLPPDTSLAEARDLGVLRVCVPPAYPPLVTGDPARPGLDIELLTALAEKLGLRLSINTNPAIGRDFNPRAWRVTRAQCLVIAGGVIASPQTRSFIETALPHGETRWTAVSREALPPLRGLAVAVLPGASGLDRVALSSYLRSEGASVTIARDATALAASLADGRVDAAVTESLLAATVAEAGNFTLTPLPDSLGRYTVAFGLWKGDLTLKRALTSAFRELERDGTVAAIEQRYVGAASPDAVTPAP